MSRVLDYNNGVLQTFHEEDNKIHIKTSEDVSDILRLNKIDRNHSDRTGSNMRHAARIPITVWAGWREQLKAQGRNPDPWHKDNRAWLLATLNNKEWLKLRTSEDRL